MNVFTSVLSAVFWGALVLSLLVFVHEGAHFVAARAFGMRVTEFFLGLPCRFKLSWKSKRFGTEFGITPLLLGGYNRICGMEAEPDDLVAPALAIVQRSGRICLDDLSRELGVDADRALDILTYLMDLGSIRPYYNPDKGEHPWQKNWPDEFETLQRDANMLTEYDSDHDFSTGACSQAGEGRVVQNQDAFLAQEEARTYGGKGFVARIVTLAAGPLINILVAYLLIVVTVANIDYIDYANTNEVGGIIEGSLAEEAGLREGDVILQLGGHNVDDWTSLVNAIESSLEAGGDIRIAYLRDGQTFETTIAIPADEKVDILGIAPATVTKRLTIGEASSTALHYMAFVGKTVARLVQPTHTMEVMEQSSSIVGISAMASEAASSGLSDFILFAAAISLSLGYMNLLPIPPLDGGKIVIECIQFALRRPLSMRAKNIVSYVGLAFFLFIFVFALRNDIMRIMGLM